MWIFTSAAVNIHFVLQYMMFMCENKKHHGMKKVAVKEASCKLDVLFLFHFVFTISLFRGQILINRIENAYFLPIDGIW